MECLFCKIAGGELPAAVVFEDANSLAFLDYRPLFAGHCLLVPKRHYETLMDVPADELGPLFANAPHLCSAMEEALGAQGTFVAINNRVSQSVPHLHIHIVPRRPKDGLKGFFWPRRKYESDAEMESVRAALADSMRRRGKPTND
jgi:histidine triad (HIT) family protein